MKKKIQKKLSIYLVQCKVTSHIYSNKTLPNFNITGGKCKSTVYTIQYLCRSWQIFILQWKFYPFIPTKINNNKSIFTNYIKLKRIAGRYINRLKLWYRTNCWYG